MDLTIVRIEDQTPKGLTTGFRLKFQCAAPDGRAFVLDAPLLVSPQVMAKQMPLPCLVLAYLRREGFSAGPDLFIDTRRLKLDELSSAEPALPLTLTLGGPEPLNQRAVEALIARGSRA